MQFSTSNWLLIDEWWSADNKYNGNYAVYCTDRDTSVSLCVSQPAAWTTTSMRRKESRIYLYARSGKSEGEVTNKRRLCSTYCTIEANYRQTRSIAHGLSATARLLVIEADYRQTRSIACGLSATAWLLVIEADYRQTRSIARPLCDSVATCYRS